MVQPNQQQIPISIPENLKGGVYCNNAGGAYQRGIFHGFFDDGAGGRSVGIQGDYESGAYETHTGRSSDKSKIV